MSPSPPCGDFQHVVELLEGDDHHADRLRIRMGWPIDQKLVKYRIVARAPEHEPWSVVDFIRGLVDVGRVHESAFVTRITSEPSVFSRTIPGLVVVDFFAPHPWSPQRDSSLPGYEGPRSRFAQYYAGGPGTRHWPEGDDVP